MGRWVAGRVQGGGVGAGTKAAQPLLVCVTRSGTILRWEGRSGGGGGCLHEGGPAVPGLGGQGLLSVLLDAGLREGGHQLQPHLAVHALAVRHQLRVLWLLCSRLETLQQACTQGM